MRQAGVIAAAGIVALEKMVDRLAEDHAHARYIAEELLKIGGLNIDLETVQTNMVYCDTSPLKISANQFVSLLKAEGLLISAVSPHQIRLVTSRHVTEKEAREVVTIMKRVVENNC